MKFRTIFILFNVVILVSFLFVFFLPIFVLGGSASLDFWKGNWYLALLFVLLIGGLNAFFVLNRKTFGLVEREAWGELSAHLVGLMFPRSRFTSSHIRLLVNAYLLQSDLAGIERLEQELKAKRPALLRKNALVFGVSRLLRNRGDEVEEFLGPYLDAKNVDSKDWLRFDYGFSLVLQKKTAGAIPFLEEGCSARDPVLCLLSAYLLGSVGVAALGEEAAKAAARARAEAAKAKLLKKYDQAKWGREVERAKSEVHIVILSKLIDDAARWLFEPSASAAARAGAPAGAAPAGPEAKA